MKTNTQTLVPAVLESAIKPKPTKREVIEAMARIQIEKLQAENKAATEEMKKLEQEIRDLSLGIVKKSSSIRASLDLYVYSEKPEEASVHLRVSIGKADRTPALNAKLVRYNEAKKRVVTIPSLKEAMQQIRQTMEDLTPGQSRVDAMLKAPDSRKALEAMLEELN